MPRIVGGAARGRRLAVPRGDRVRPTSDKVREALFNILTHRFEGPIDGARVLDLFAGAGTLGAPPEASATKPMRFKPAFWASPMTSTTRP